MSKALGFQLRITVETKPDGRIDSMQVENISILEDLWLDYLYFKQEAKGSSSFRQKRYLRAAMLVFIAYLEGVINRWYHNWLVDQGKSDKEIRDSIRNTHTYRKCKLLTDQAVRKDPSIKEPALDEVKKLRNELAHLKVGRDLAIFDSLTVTILDDSEKKIVDWLDMISKALGIERHPDTKKLAGDLAQKPNVVAEEYSGDES